MLLVAALAASTAQAQESHRFSVSGFGTVGLVTQTGADGWRLLRNSAQAAANASTSAIPDSRAGIQLNWSTGSHWEGVFQAVALKRPPDARASESVEWAYVGYRSGGTRIRIGRTSPDMFLYADSRNVGYALPWARPPIDFYGFAPTAAVDGIDLEQRWPDGDGQWRARLTAGSFSVSSTDPEGGRFPIKSRDALAIGLSREAGGLLLKASYSHSRLSLEAPPELGLLRDGLTQIAALPVPGLATAIAPLQRNVWMQGPVSYLGLGMQLERGPWSFTAEASNLWVPDSPLDARRGYASVGYRLRGVTYYGLVSRVLPKRPAAAVPDLVTTLTPVLGSDGASAAQQLADAAGAASVLYRYDQSTFGLGLRWDLMRSASLKLQVDRFKVHPNGSAGWVHGDANAARGTLYSVVLDFVWGQ